MEGLIITFIEIGLVLGFLWMGFRSIFSLWRVDKFFFFRPVMQVEGVVTGHGKMGITDDFGREYDLFCAKFSFADDAGRLIECSDQWVSQMSSRPLFGTKVPVIYPIGFPEKARLKFGLKNSLTNMKSYIMSIFLSVVGLIGLYWFCTGDDRVKLWLVTIQLKLLELIASIFQ